MPIIKLDNVSVRRGHNAALTDINWELNPGHNWAVIGGNGAGKSTFLSLVRGDIWPDQTAGKRYYFDAEGNSSLSPIGFREQTTTISAEQIDHYVLLERIINGRILLMSGLRNTPLIYAPPTQDEWDKVDDLAQRMGVENLLEKPLPECSTGQLKRLFLARAMACNPQTIFLDEYADGLDRHSRLEIMDLIDQIADTGVQILCATHRATELPACINRILMLESGRIIHSGTRTLSAADDRTQSGINDMNSASPETVRQTATMDFSLLPCPEPVSASVPVLSLTNATAGIEGTTIIHNANLDVWPGDRWMITGPNGAGKSTLLRMIAGELPAALGGEVRWFGQGRMPDDERHNDFWAIRQRLGLVTPRLQTLHRMEIKVMDVVLSGFWQHIGLHEFPTPEMETGAQCTLSALGIADLAERYANTLSYGQLRKAIIARALVNSPSLLILDEPFSGLDAPSRADMRSILRGLAGQGLTMIMATHHPEESRGWATGSAVIENGTLVIQKK